MGPQERRLHTALSGEQAELVFTAARRWEAGSRMLESVSRALEGAAPEIGEQFARTGPAARRAFTTVAGRVTARGEQMRAAADALTRAADELRIAASARDELGPEPQAPTEPRPVPGQNDMERVRAQQAYATAVGQHTAALEARERRAQAAADRLEAALAEAAGVMREVHGDPVRSSGGSSGGGLPDGAGGGAPASAGAAPVPATQPLAQAGTAPARPAGGAVPGTGSPSPGPGVLTTPAGSGDGAPLGPGATGVPPAAAATSGTTGAVSGGTGPGTAAGVAAAMGGAALGGVAGIGGALRGGAVPGAPATRGAAGQVRPVGTTSRAAGTGTLGRTAPAAGATSGTRGTVGARISSGGSGTAGRAPGGTGTPGAVGATGSRGRERARDRRADEWAVAEQDWVDDEPTGPDVLD